MVIIALAIVCVVLYSVSMNKPALQPIRIKEKTRPHRRDR